ncbi:hypothetical protein Moror_5501 [Moniliophthora roreri MCA 2997]|uniref:Uncharacterized protein n=1 Tax=Moniliophthora roreri (strain MCA 2997) TaxID=1381753 RepID=V2X611_MONRO|nr:hypothetical protein Moror_5501 [Moniliophthora roreri MCA 2997]
MTPMFWLSWAALASCTGLVKAFSIAPITEPVTPGQIVTVSWFRNAGKTDGFALVESIVDESPPGSSAVIPVAVAPSQTEGATQILILQDKPFVLQAVKTKKQGQTKVLFSGQTITPMPPSTSPSASSTTMDTSSNGSSTSIPTTTAQSDPSTLLSTSDSLSAGESTATLAPSDSPEIDPLNDRGGATSNSNRTSTIIITSTIGGVVFIVLLLLIFIFLCRRKNPNRISVSTLGSGFFFDKERMVKAPPPREATYSAISLSSTRTPSFSETVITEIHGPRARTDRQMEIEDKILALQGEMISVSRLHGRSSPEEAEIRERIERLQVLKDGDWALERSDEKPREML